MIPDLGLGPIIQERTIHMESRNFGGCYRYDEILRLFNHPKISTTMGWVVEYCEIQMNQGKMGRTWFYFDYVD